jgi:hypothetical protein
MASIDDVTELVARGNRILDGDEPFDRPFVIAPDAAAVFFKQALELDSAYAPALEEMTTNQGRIVHVDDGFDVVSGKNFSHVAWESVREVIERPRYIRFVLNKSESLIIPKRFITEDADARAIREIAAYQLEGNAKRLH